jgi:hypothetical protein
VERAFDQEDAKRVGAWEGTIFEEELKALGTILQITGWTREFELKLDALDPLRLGRNGRPTWFLLSATAEYADGRPKALVWISDEYRPEFLKLFSDFSNERTPSGKPKNRELVANMARIRRAVLDDLWQSRDAPPKHGMHWWELWLRDDENAEKHVTNYAAAIGARLAKRSLKINGFLIVRIYTIWRKLHSLLVSPVSVTEIRAPDFCGSYAELPGGEQGEYVAELAGRVLPVINDSAPLVCHLDTGVRRSHLLLAHSLEETDTHSVVDSAGGWDRCGHGTAMAGLALYGPLGPPMAATDPVVLRHRLESVKFLPDGGDNETDSFGIVTADAVAQPEATRPGPARVFCMPITSPGDSAPGEPTLWSASIDALAAGAEIAREAGKLLLLRGPQPDASRLFIISAGNVPQAASAADHIAVSDGHPIENPAQAWNALTVGAYTDNVATSLHPDFDDWVPVAAQGELSPHSRTGFAVPGSWPNKPDFCMEGGNVLTDGADGFDPHHVSSLSTTTHTDDRAIGSSSATSAATAQAARLAALVHAEYPSLWPETVRGLLVHAARWTPAMETHLRRSRTKGSRVEILRRYGWGVPTEDRVLHSASDAAHLIIQDAFVPYALAPKGGHIAHFQHHTLPWPHESLTALGETEIEMRVTLSYFVEPAASRRGWRRRFSYPSHGLRFDIKRSTESPSEFLARLVRDPADDTRSSTPNDDGWFLGTRGRNLGSLHQDLWNGSAAELAERGTIAVHPVKGWWHYNNRKDRRDLAVRYALIVSLRCPSNVDLYTPIAAEIAAEIAVPAS